MATSATMAETVEALFIENVGDLRMATSWAYKVFSECQLLRGAIDSARTLKGAATPIVEHCKRILRNSGRLTKYANQVLVRVRKHLEGELTDSARTFLDGVDHILVGLLEAVTQRIENKVIETRERVQAVIGEQSRLDQALFETGKESVFYLASSLVEAADQIRRQLPKDWTVATIMRHADPFSVNGKKPVTTAII